MQSSGAGHAAPPEVGAAVCDHVRCAAGSQSDVHTVHQPAQSTGGGGGGDGSGGGGGGGGGSCGAGAGAQSAVSVPAAHTCMSCSVSLMSSSSHAPSYAQTQVFRSWPLTTRGATSTMRPSSTGVMPPAAVTWKSRPRRGTRSHTEDFAADEEPAAGPHPRIPRRGVCYWVKEEGGGALVKFGIVQPPMSSDLPNRRGMRS
jgi:hypothetical protein